MGINDSIIKEKARSALGLSELGRLLLENFLVALCYWGVGVLATSFFAQQGLFPSPIWPSAALALVACIYRGALIAPGVFAGSLLANHLSIGASLPLALSLSCFNALGPCFAAVLIVRFLGGAVRFSQLYDVAVFSLFGVLLHSLISGFGGALSMVLLGALDVAKMGRVFLLWWLSDASGALFFAPVILHWLMPWDSVGISRRRLLEALLAGVISLALAWLCFWRLAMEEGGNQGVPWLMLLPLLWTSGRIPAVFSQTILLGIIFIAITGAVSHHGVFYGGEHSLALRSAGMMILGLSSTVLFANALLAERRQSEQALKLANEVLENKVGERTLALARNEEKYRTIFESAAVGMALVGPDSHYLAANQRWCKMTGFSEEELRSISPLELLKEEHREECALHARRLFAGEEKSYRSENAFYNRVREILWVEVSIVPMYNALGGVESLLTVMADVTERYRSRELLHRQLEEIQALQESLREQAIRDSLTGLFNRRYLDEMLERECSRAGRDGYPLSLIIADVDHFKRFNDRYGHKAGDRMLQALGELVSREIRLGDIACRFGGEEFVLILPHASLAAARERAESLRVKFQALQVPHGEEMLSSTLSLGVAVLTEQGGNAESLLHAADQALYEAKAGGRNRVVESSQAD